MSDAFHKTRRDTHRLYRELTGGVAEESRRRAQTRRFGGFNEEGPRRSICADLCFVMSLI